MQTLKELQKLITQQRVYTALSILFIVYAAITIAFILLLHFDVTAVVENESMLSVYSAFSMAPLVLVLLIAALAAIVGHFFVFIIISFCIGGLILYTYFAFPIKGIPWTRIALTVWFALFVLQAAVL